MFRFIDILISTVIAYGMWNLAEYLNEDPIKVMLIYICAIISDAVYVLRNKG